MPTDFAPGPAQSADGAPPFALLDAEKLDCYRLAVEFQALATRTIPRRSQAVLRDQLDRASVSIVLNIAEGAGRVSPADKARFYAMARGSATECAAVMDLLWARGLLDPALRNRARALLVRIVQMLTRLRASMVRSQ